MATFRIPLTNTFESWEQVLTIDGIKYVFRYRYNGRNDTWYLTILNVNREILIESIPCLTDVIGMTNRLNVDALQAETIFIDISANSEDCTRDNFGENIIQLYNRPDALT